MDLSIIERRHTDGLVGDVATKHVVLKGLEVESDERLVKGIASTEGVDMDGDVVLQDGMDTTYFWGAAPEEGVRSVYWDHQYHEKPVGKCSRMKKTANGLYVSTYVTSLPAGDELLTLVGEGIVRGLSVAFRTLESGDPTIDESKRYGKSCNRVVRKSVLLEYSFTAMPCNPEALLALKSLRERRLVSDRMAKMVASATPYEMPRIVVGGGGCFTVE